MTVTGSSMASYLLTYELHHEIFSSVAICSSSYEAGSLLYGVDESYFTSCDLKQVL
jgi:hypothetical protein